MPKPGPRPLNALDSVGKFCGNSKFRKSSFYVLLLILAILTCVDVVKLVRGYLTDNVDTDMYIQFNDTMTMPNVTFCMSKEQAWSHFKMAGLNASDIDNAVEAGFKNMTSKKAFLTQHWDYKMVIDAYLVVQALNSLERETSALGSLKSIQKLANEPRLGGMRKSMKNWLGQIAKIGVSFEEFFQKVGQETLKRSLQRFQRLSTNEGGRQIRNSVRIMWLSQVQLCFQPLFDRDNFKPIEDQDQFFTLSLAYNSENVETIDCMTLDMKGRPSDEARFMEGHGRAKDGFYDELCIGEMHEVEVELRSVSTSLPDAEEEQKKCRRYNSGVDKSELECRSRCRSELIRKACACTPLTLAYLASPDELEQFPLCDYEKCNKFSPEVQNLTNWDDTCGSKCYPDCTQSRYVINNVKKTAPRKELIQVTLFWGSFEYLRLVQKEKWSFSKFFSNLGGSLGVWLGLSVLSVIQFITFLLTRAHKRVKRKLSTAVSNEGGHRGGKHSRVSDVSGSSEQHRKNNPLGGGISMNPFGGKKEKV